MSTAPPLPTRDSDAATDDSEGAVAPREDLSGAPRCPRPTKERPYLHAVEVRYAETDQMGVVHHANYLRYLEDARTIMLRECALPYSDVERAGYGLPVRSVEIQYNSPAFFEDVLVVACWIERTRAASVTFGYEIHRRVDGERGPLLLTAEIELACIDLASRRAQAFPNMLKRFFIAEA